MRLAYSAMQEMWLRRTEIESLLENERYAMSEDDVDAGVPTENALLTELDYLEEKLDGRSMNEIWK